MTSTADTTSRTRFREVFAVAEFRPLFGTFLLSTAGDELARIALTVLVYARTASPMLSAFTFAIGHLPWLLGGPFLSAFADRLPRHRVLIGADVVRGLLLVVMAIPGMPLPVLLALLFLVSLCAPPFESARSALMADVLEGDRYALATSLTNTTLQIAQVFGFLAGGALVAVLSPSAALLIDAATFAVSALWLSLGLKRRPAPVAEGGDGPRSLWQDTADGLRLIRRSPRLMAIIGILWVGTLFAYAFEGVAAPLTEELGTGTTFSIGVLLAANPVGVTLGGLVVARFVSHDLRERLVVPLVAVSLVPLLVGGLLAVFLRPGTLPFALVIGLLFVAGLGAAWLIPLNVSFVRAVPGPYRGRAFGVAVSGLYGVQALGSIAAGVGAEAISAGAVLALSGGLGLVAVVPALLAYRRTEASVAADADGEGPSEA